MTTERLTAEREQKIRRHPDGSTSMAREILDELDAVRRELAEATKVDPNSRSHECRSCRGGLRNPLKDCPDCCGTAIEGTGLRRQVIALSRELNEARIVTDEMVERVAAAMFESDHPWMWIQATPTERRDYRKSARAALDAAMAKDGGT